MGATTFDMIPIIARAGDARIRALTLTGIKTKHDSTSTARGSLYGRIASGDVKLYSDPAFSTGSLVASGVWTQSGFYFAMVPENSSGIDGRAVVDSATLPAEFVAIPSFSVDEDVLASPVAASKMVGFDATYGLARFHAAAARRIITEILPSIVPNLYSGSGLSAFVPDLTAAALPDLSKIQNPSALRELSAYMVKAASFSEVEHLDEFAEVARLARERIAEIIANLKAANKVEDLKAETVISGGLQIGSFRR